MTIQSLESELKRILEENSGWVITQEDESQYAVMLKTTHETIKALLKTVDLYVKEREQNVTENTSDGYHTFKELYEFRLLYNAALFNVLWKHYNYGVHKSKLHSDRKLPFGGGWFVVSASLPTGQVTNHYELKDWDLFSIEERTTAIEWDGHTAQEAAIRLREFVKLQALRQQVKEQP